MFKFDTTFGQATARYGTACPMTESSAGFDAYLSQCSTDTTAAAGGAALPNYVSELASCNADLTTAQGDLTTCQGDLAACEATPPARLLKTGLTTSYGAGDDGDLQKGIALNYVDNGDGTITDTQTGLMWEKKSDDSTIHDKDNTYSWSINHNGAPNGQVFTTFLGGLNTGSGFAGHTDWRLPNRRELESILNLENVAPAVSASFNTNCGANSSGNLGCTVTTCSCTISSGGGADICGESATYWSSSLTIGNGTFIAWDVSFTDGVVCADDETSSHFVRAVRGGS